MAPPSEKFEITNYDVLADEISNPISSEESEVGLSLAAHSYHVGNNRLEVMCNIHNQAYTDALGKGDEGKSADIVEKIMNIVQNQCEPKGRFLERNSKGEWKEVSTEKARKLVQQALGAVQGQTTGAPLTGGETAEDIKKKQEADAEKKRRRRSSLLRRSVSSSMLPNLKAAGEELNGKFDDKKKSTRLAISPLPSPVNSRPGSRCASPVPGRIHRPVFGRSRSVELLGGARQGRRLATIDRTPLIKETMQMDVLLNTSKTGLLPGTDLHGNNRLRVMVSLQTQTFKDAKEEEQTKMAEELVKTIKEFWGGRVLSKCPTARRGGDSEGAYVMLEKDYAVGAMKHLLSGKPAEIEDGLTMGEPDAETNIKQGRRASLKAIQSIAASGGGGKTSIMPSSLPTLPADMQHLRSAAVKSLQKRKQRQGLNSRIRGLTADKAAVFQDGSSNASVMSAASGNTSPIPSKIVSNLPNIPTTLNPGLNPSMQYRQHSSGASVASTTSNLSTHPGTSYSPPPPGIVQRQGSLSNMSTASNNTNNTSMSRTTMNAARTMAQMNLGGPQMMGGHPGMMHQNSGMGANVQGLELQIPSNLMMQQPQLQQQISQMSQPMYQQHQNQFQNRPNIMMPVVQEEMNNAQFNPQPLTPDQLMMLQQQQQQGMMQGQFDPNMQQQQMERNSLLTTTGEDGLPQFQKGEMDLLIKGLQMAEQQQNRGGQ